MGLEDFRKVLLPTTRQELLVLEGKGARIRTRKGGEDKWVIDATSQVGTNPLGHRNPEILEAMQGLRESEEPLMIAGNDFYHEHQKELGEKFTDIYPGDQDVGDVKSYYCNSGSEAVERGCLKSAQLSRGGNTYIAFWNAFHGRTSLALSCNFSKAAHTEHFNSLFRALPAPYAESRMDCEQCLNHLEENIVREGPDNINAVIVEPIQGEGGYIVPDEDFLPGVRDITEEHDIPLVMDEVQASLRTGEWFACENWDVEPDMIAVAKAFSGGVTPFGASLIKEEFATEEEGKHSGTFGGNPRDCYAALKTIEIIEENRYLENAGEQGAYMAAEWEELEENEIVKEERGVGLMRGIEFHDVEERDEVLEVLYDEYDILTLGCGNEKINPAMRFLLPVNVDREIVEEVTEGVIQAVHDVAR